ncbi:SRPBCC family protein [Microbulbifer sp. 2201CG32-9]|uniref:hypothetical protein n=1 Tax=Microbulbifer sp. 2201CG32-9 TaxID=3232309 RepID=UPI00345C5D00
MLKIKLPRIISAIAFSLVSASAAAQIYDLETDLGDSYYYTDHFEITIDKPADRVWPQLLHMGQWMPWMAVEGGDSKPVTEGDRVNLYGDVTIEVVKVIPRKMILLANLPHTDRGEQSQGIAMISIAESDGKTLVSLFMNRIYHWFDEAENPQRATRVSADFASQRQATFRDRFLAKLKQLAESQP